MSIFRHLPDNIIEIDGEKFDLDLFLELEPEYSIPKGFISREYDGERHILYSKDNQTLGECPWEDGERYLTRIPDLHLLQKTIIDDLNYIESLKNNDDTQQMSKNDINKNMLVKEMVFSMWEHFVEGKSKEETINKVQEKLKVKENI